MSHRPTLCLLGLLCALSVPPAVAQELSDSERAKRDAAKVFNFIKFHAVRAKSAPVAGAAAAAAAPAAPARPRPEPAAEPAARPAADVAARPAPEPAQPSAPAPAVAAASAAPASATGLDSQPGTTLPPASEPAPAPAPTATPQPEPEPEPVDIKLIHHVQPEVPPGNNLRDGTVRVRFTVEPDGRVSKAVAAPGAQRRLASSATRAIEQWRFAPIPEAQEIEVDIDFRFD